ncbi:MAG: glycerol-3-phosphate dehydrogenase/oxidase [Bacteroidales bacterium]|nr:glycerol-3-phosphate dehydrogenase/oxidase [Bacteroidales bacterium]
MDRDSMIDALEHSGHAYDIVVIGGGASGLGAALEAVSRGYRTILLEQDDFAKGTSSRSTKLVHGGVRYLAQGNISLVLEALKERGRLKRNAPHLVKDQAFVIPCYHWWCVPFYTIGLTLYDLMAGRLGIGRSVPLSARGARKALPALKTKKLRGGVRYFDCQFDDARLAVNLAQSVVEKGGLAINHMKVKGLIPDGGNVRGVTAEDGESGKTYKISAAVVINATGVFVDDILKMENPEARDVVKPSQGIHLVMDPDFLKGEQALMIPKTSDGRVLFAVPWHNRVVVGTTDVEKQHAELEPLAEEEEVEYILETARLYMEHPPSRSDVLAVFTGLRPLAAPASEGKKTKEISRGHKILVSGGGLITLTGGKWTTYRKMAEDVVDVAARQAGLPVKKSVTATLKIYAYREGVDRSDPLHWYGSDREQLDKLVSEDPAMGELISEKLQIIRAQIVWAVRAEMARNLEDCLSRRIRALQLDVRESIRMAPAVASILAKELGKDKTWETRQVEAFTKLAARNLLN